jgi:hypothetical protein
VRIAPVFLDLPTETVDSMVTAEFRSVRCVCLLGSKIGEGKAIPNDFGLATISENLYPYAAREPSIRADAQVIE